MGRREVKNRGSGSRDGGVVLRKEIWCLKLIRLFSGGGIVDFPQCAVFRQDGISYILVLPEDIPSEGLPVLLRANVVEDAGRLRMDFIDRPGVGLGLDVTAEGDLKASMRLFLFLAEEHSRGIVAEIIPTWNGLPHEPDPGF